MPKGQTHTHTWAHIRRWPSDNHFCESIILKPTVPHLAYIITVYVLIHEKCMNLSGKQFNAQQWHSAQVHILLRI